MAAFKGKAVVSQSGGPTVVINASLVGVIEEAAKHAEITELLGSKHAVRGMRDNQFVKLSGLDPQMLEVLAQTPSSGLGSSRDKPDAAYCQAIFETFKKNDVKYFFYIGGNDSADTARIINEMAGQANYQMRAVHIPKTIDNDLRNNDHTPGFGSAARFVASAFMGDDLDNRSLPGVKIDVVMGRNAGFLTAASTLGRSYPDAGPHLVYCPEVPFDTKQFVQDVQAVLDRLGRCLIAVSEGISDSNKKEIAAVLVEQSGKAVERDSHGNVQLSGSGVLGDELADLVKKQVKFQGKPRVRSDTFGYLQRSFPGVNSSVDLVEAREVGRLAVRWAVQEDHSGTVLIQRASAGSYKAEFKKGKFEDVARTARHMSREFLNEKGNDTTQAWKDYALPLVGELPKITVIV